MCGYACRSKGVQSKIPQRSSTVSFPLVIIIPYFFYPSFGPRQFQDTVHSGQTAKSPADQKRPAHPSSHVIFLWPWTRTLLPQNPAMFLPTAHLHHIPIAVRNVNTAHWILWLRVPLMKRHRITRTIPGVSGF